MPTSHHILLLFIYIFAFILLFGNVYVLKCCYSTTLLKMFVIYSAAQMSTTESEISDEYFAVTRLIFSDVCERPYII